MLIAVVLGYHHAFFLFHLNIALQIQPGCNLAAVQWLLLNQADRDVLFLAHQRLLIGTVRQEITFQNIFGAPKLGHFRQMVFCFIESAELVGKR